jgi:hypothetical protein
MVDPSADEFAEAVVVELAGPGLEFFEVYAELADLAPSPTFCAT